MKKLIPLLFVFALAGCGTVTNLYNAATGATVSPTAVIVAANSFDALEATATNYIRLKKCSATSGPICRNPDAVAAIVPAIRSGRVARNNLEQFLQDHPGALGPQGLYDALQESIDTLRKAFAQYGVN